MSHLLVVSGLTSKAMRRKGSMPLFLEYGVSPETAPYLVSSSSSVMWIQEPHPGNLVRAAVRQVGVDDFFSEVVGALVLMGGEMQWGNIHPLTIEGLRAAVDHVGFYELGPVELLIPMSHQSKGGLDPLLDDEPNDEPLSVGLIPPEIRPLIDDIGLPFRASSWVPTNTIVVVPKDRSFVGVVNKVTPTKISGVVHNAARGIAIAQGFPGNELVG